MIPEESARTFRFSYDCEPIKKRDSYQSCAARLDAKGRTFSDYNTTLDGIEKAGWMFSYAERPFLPLPADFKDIVRVLHEFGVAVSTDLEFGD